MNNCENLPFSLFFNKGSNISTCFDFESNDTTSNKNGTSTTDEFVKQSDGGSMSGIVVTGTVVNKLSMHMLSKCA